MNSRLHLDDEIHDLLDGRLEPPERARVEAHLQECAACRSRREEIERLKLSLRSALAPGTVPAELRASLDEALRREASRPPGRTASRTALPLLLAASLAVIAAGVLLFARRDAVSDAARDFTRYKTGTLELSTRTENTAALERHFAENGIPFPARVFDLGMMGFRLVGGKVHRFGGGPSALFVYRSEEGRILVCQMYEGTTRRLPRGAERRTHNGIDFLVYGRDGGTVVFWQEGEIVCVLAGDAPREDVVALAYAKAVRS